MHNIKDEIVEKIKTGQVMMRPRWYFLLETILWIMGAILCGIISIYLMSFVLYVLREAGFWLTPGFGAPGLIFLMTASPWPLIGVLGLFLGVLYLLIAHFSFSYRRPLLYTLLSVVFGVIVVAALVHQTSFHHRFEQYLDTHPVPGMSFLYEHHGRSRMGGVTVGKIIAVRNPDIVIETDRAEIYLIRIVPETRLSPNVSLTVGEIVLISGDRSDDEIVAVGVKPASSDMMASPGKFQGSRHEQLELLYTD